MEQPKEYYAFISYKREDKREARRLQHALEYYRLPNHLRQENPELPEYVRPVFRDMTDLEVGELSAQIHAGLEQSHFLIVVCSPRAATSKWVNDEVEYFISLGKQDKIIPYIIEGIPHASNPDEECYPPALLNLSKEKELLGANINEVGKDSATIRVVSRMFNIRFDTLFQRYEREQRRKRWMWIGGSILIALLGLSIGGYFVRQKGIIERQKERLQQDSITMANHLLQISAQNDSIAQQNNLILSQRDSIDNSMKQLQMSNKLLAEERDNVLRANWKMMENQSLAVAEIGNTLIDEGDNYLARILALSILPKNVKSRSNRPFVPEAEALLRNATQKDAALLNTNIQVYDVAFSPDGKHVASANGDYTVRIWNRFTGVCVDTLEGHNNYVFSVEYMEDGNRIVSIDKDEKEACIWDAHTGELLNKITNYIEHGDSMIWLLKTSKKSQWFSPDYTQMAKIENKRNYVIIQDLTKKSKVLCSQKEGYYYATFSPDGKHVITCSDSIIRIWNKENCVCVDSLIGHNKAVIKALYNNNGTQVVSTSFDNTTRIWNIKTKKAIHILRGHKGRTVSATFSKDGKFVVSASADSTVRIWNTTTGDCTDSLKLKSAANAAIFDPCGKYIVTGTAKMDNTVQIWEVSNGKFGNCITTLRDHHISVTNISFSPNGRLFASASASSENAIIIWDITKKCSTLPPLLGHTNHVLSVSFNNDGAKIVSASEDNSIRVWDVSTGICLVVLKEHGKRVTHAEFSPNGRQIISSSSDGTVRIWDFPSLQRLINETRERFKNRPLSPMEKRKYYLE